MRGIGLIFDHSPHYLDHLGPFCALLGWPLLVSDPFLYEEARTFYPDLCVQQVAAPLLGRVALEYSCVVSCDVRREVGSALGGLPNHTLWLPHGQSDKDPSSFAALREEEWICVYGQKMREQVQSALIHTPSLLSVGHFRCHYFQTRRSLYRPFTDSLFLRAQPTLLYAPTWEDAEGNSSLGDHFLPLAAALPVSCNLCVKLHPNTAASQEALVERWIGQTERENLRFLLRFPPVLPLLAHCQAYLGDRSSIGYDCLAFPLPLFFLTPCGHSSTFPLAACGESVTPQSLFEQEWRCSNQELARQATRAYTFDPTPVSEWRGRVQELG